MKTCTLLFAAVLGLFLCGCTSLTNTTEIADKLQNILTNVLPPGFSGDVHISEVNPYFDIGVDITNVHKNSDGKWTWEGVNYHRADAFHTSGNVTLTTRAPVTLVPAPAVTPVPAPVATPPSN